LNGKPIRSKIVKLSSSISLEIKNLCLDEKFTLVSLNLKRNHTRKLDIPVTAHLSSIEERSRPV